MAGLLRCIVDSAQTDHQPDQTSTPETAPAMPVGSLWSRQWLFLRRRWWNADSLTPTQRVASFGRGVILIAVAAFGTLIVVHNTLNLNARGMDAIAKLMAEFLLIPVGLLALDHRRLRRLADCPQLCAELDCRRAWHAFGDRVRTWEEAQSRRNSSSANERPRTVAN